MADVLDEIFETSDEDVETFSDFVQATADKSLTDKEVARIRSTASFVTETQKFYCIEHGRHEDHYAWHISPASEKRGWQVDIKRVVFAIAKLLRKHLPDEIIIDVHLPDVRNGVEVLTVRANDVAANWAVSEQDLATITNQLFEVLNAL